MIEIRPLHKDEIDLARHFVPETDGEPHWENIWAILDEKELVGIIGMENRLVVEPMYMKNGNYSQALMAMSWVDGFVRPIATQQGKNGYEFFIGDSNKRFQELVERHMPVKKGREKVGLYFFRKFEV